jgi:mono/diheme cytochrome c family protein
VLIATVALATACGQPSETHVTPEHMTDFRTLYETNCAGCHGVDGQQGAAQRLNDSLYMALVNDAQLTTVISSGVRGTPMLPFAREAGGTLSSEQIRILVEGMRREWGSSRTFAGVALPAYTAQDAAVTGALPGDPARGSVAYRTYCSRCHGPDGQGSSSAGSIVDAAFLSLTSDQGLRTTVIAGHPDESTRDWRQYAPGRPMSEQDISDVVAWLSARRKAGQLVRPDLVPPKLAATPSRANADSVPPKLAATASRAKAERHD